MKNSHPLALNFVLLALVAPVWGELQTPPPRSSRPPNIVLLFSDDAGYADFGFTGSRYFRTPQLDRLAAAGVRLTQFYVTASVCGPSRAGLLTGQYQQKFGFEENNVPGYMSPSSRLDDLEMGLAPGPKTIADHLRDLGYRTAVFGKWHQGNSDHLHPLKRGFDEFVGFRGGSRSFFAYSSGDAKAAWYDHLEYGFRNFREPQKYLTDLLADEACAFVERNRDRPFFAYVAFNAVHTPLEADPRDAALFPELSGRRRKLAQMTFSMDRAIGRIVDTLEKLGLTNNTLIVFANDNGGPTDVADSSNHPFSGTKATELEGGIRVPAFAVWPGHLTPAKNYDQPLSTLDLLPTFVAAAGGNATAIPDLDGLDVLPYLTSTNSGRPHQTLYWREESRAAVRDGDWKLIRFMDRPAELYDLAKDSAEENDLAAANPAIVRELYRKLFTWELTLERPLFQLKKLYEGKAVERLDKFRKQSP